MKLNKLHIATLLLLCGAMASCNRAEQPVTDLQRSPIALSVGGVDSNQEATKAVVTDGTDKTLNPFDQDTKIFFVIKSTKDATVHDGFEYKGPRASVLYTTCRGDVTKDATEVVFDDVNKRYWDDAHARSSQLDCWAYAQKGMTWKECTFEEPNPGGEGINAYKDYTVNTAVKPTPVAWRETEVYPAIRNWSASHRGDKHQDAESVMCQDLLFSNNLANNQEYNGRGGDTRLKFNFSTKKFPQTSAMIFYHAMSKITIHIKKGLGYEPGESFNFTPSPYNIKLSGFNTKGIFNIKTGQFEYIWEHADIPYICKLATPAPGDAHTLEALVIPNINGNTEFPDTYSRLNNGNTTTVMDFEIEHSRYVISQDALFDALTAIPENEAYIDGDVVNFKPGVNYHFTFTVGKKQIDNITARVTDWETVNADNHTPSNARITIDVEDRSSNTSAVTSNMDIYRALDEASTVTDTYEGFNWTTGYLTSGKATWHSNPLDYNADKWSTDWFWESNKTYYHFRTLSPTTQVVKADAVKGDYTEIQSADCANVASYNQVAWGASFYNVADDYKFTYSTEKGFDGTASGHQIYKAIGPTNDPIKVLMFHMMSGVHFTVQTPDDVDKVQLFDGTNRTTVELIKYYADGVIRLGTGVVNTDGTISTEADPYEVGCVTDTEGHYVPQNYFFSAVPQSLANVELHITTPDHNLYKVKMADLVVSSGNITSKNLKNPYSANASGKYIIDSWYPGFKYTYTFNLRKSGIKDIEATVVDWESVEADDEDIYIQ